MEDTSEDIFRNSPVKRVTIGLLAHVDAGKTTLSEGMLYKSGVLRKLGRVDNQDAYLDTDELERKRGITIFSKQAVLPLENVQITLLDTPGHVDFSAEMERTLQVLDYAVLVISATDGVQGHTRTLWRLLEQYNVPVFLFVNKMDQSHVSREHLLQELRERLSGGCFDGTVRLGTRNGLQKITEKLTEYQEENCLQNGMANSTQGSTEEIQQTALEWNAAIEAFYEELAVTEEGLFDYFLENGTVEKEDIARLIGERKVFPCFFGSALRVEGVEELLEGIRQYTRMPEYSQEFGAKIFKITRDEMGNRLTHLKITGGTLKVKDTIRKYGEDGEILWQEKVNQIRLYSGSKYEPQGEIGAGGVCVVTGLTMTHPGEGVGIESNSFLPILEPVLTYQVKLPPDCHASQMMPKLYELEEEEPQLHIIWDEELQEIQIQVMGEIQIEILKSLIYKRFGVEVGFDKGHIVYKETILHPVEGVGHFEPLRHYAEVHLLLEPAERGSGIQVLADCSEDLLERSWQRLILGHLEEKAHKGVMTGSVITDMRITLKSGKAHLKHTEGGDFRQAAYRAVRQGLMEAESILLEPVYEFRLEIPRNVVGRAMSDIERRNGTFILEQNQEEMAVLTGTCPVASMQDYQGEVAAYTKGNGRLFCNLKGYDICHDPEPVMEEIGYIPERDISNPADSVFCAHGAGFVVPWYEVKEYMHVESIFSKEQRMETLEGAGGALNPANPAAIRCDDSIDTTGAQRGYRAVRGNGPKKDAVTLGTEEVDSIIARTYQANKKEKDEPGRSNPGKQVRVYQEPSSALYSTTANQRQKEPLEAYLLVDGYNIIFAWEDLKALAEINIDSARGKLLDILCNYQGIRQMHVIAVFDAYRVQGHQTEIFDYHNIHVVYTKEAETADQYIERFAHENSRRYLVTVATSDGLEQMIIRGKGCRLFSAREFRNEVEEACTGLRREYLEKQPSHRMHLLDVLPKGTFAELRAEAEVNEITEAEVNEITEA